MCRALGLVVASTSMRRSTVNDSSADSAGQRGGNFDLKERAFAPLPKTSQVHRRRVDVQKFRSAPAPHERPRWNASVMDEAHPFPQRAMTNTTTVYHGADTVETHFPESIRGTVNLRVPEAASQSRVWQDNVAKSRTSHHNTYQCAALDDPEPPLSYLAQTIVEDNAPEKLRCRQQWNASTTQEGVRGNRFVAPATEPDYAALNREATKTMTSGRYLTPSQRSTQMAQNVRRTKELKREAAGETALSLYQRAEGPVVFKMSNIDQWWGMDPVQVAVEQTTKRKAMHDNEYSSYHTTTKFPVGDVSSRWAGSSAEEVGSTAEEP